MSNPPEIYCGETLKYLHEIFRASNIIVSSNTMFITGDTLKKCIAKTGMAKSIDDYRFSDEVGYSKPHGSMFANSDFHIGDNPLTDYVGARKCGSQPIIINSNDKTLKDAYDIITEAR